MRNNSGQSTKSARDETSKQTMMKDQAKEEQKKRATKGERKRQAIRDTDDASMHVLQAAYI